MERWILLMTLKKSYWKITYNSVNNKIFYLHAAAADVLTSLEAQDRWFWRWTILCLCNIYTHVKQPKFLLSSLSHIAPNTNEDDSIILYPILDGVKAINTLTSFGVASSCNALERLGTSRGFLTRDRCKMFLKTPHRTYTSVDSVRDDHQWQITLFLFLEFYLPNFNHHCALNCTRET